MGIEASVSIGEMMNIYWSLEMGFTLVFFGIGFQS